MEDSTLDCWAVAGRFDGSLPLRIVDVSSGDVLLDLCVNRPRKKASPVLLAAESLAAVHNLSLDQRERRLSPDCVFPPTCTDAGEREWEIAESCERGCWLVATGGHDEHSTVLVLGFVPTHAELEAAIGLCRAHNAAIA